MILTCPQCATRYQTDAAKFQPSGRNVRCAKCGHLWHQDAPAPEPEAAMDIAIADAEPVAAPSPVVDVPPPQPQAYAPAPQPQAYVPAPQSQAYVPNPVISREPVQAPTAPAFAVPSNLPMRLAVGAGWLGLVAIVLLIGWSALRFRQQIAAVWPQSSSLYSAVGMKTNASGLNIEDVAYHRGVEDGQSVLSVTGMLTNSGTREMPVPQLRVGLIDDDRHELYHWTFVPGVMTLKPGQTTKFQTRLSNPPAAASHFELRFARAGD